MTQKIKNEYIIAPFRGAKGEGIICGEVCFDIVAGEQLVIANTLVSTNVEMGKIGVGINIISFAEPHKAGEVLRNQKVYINRLYAEGEL